MLHLKSVEGQTQDLQFVNEQGQTRIRELEAENTALSKRLELAMIGGGDQGGQRGVLDGTNKKVSFAPGPAKFELSHTLAGENNDPNAIGGQFGAYQSQADVWTEELRRADDRCNKFK